MSAEHSSHEPHNTISAKAYEAARVLEGEGYQIVVLVAKRHPDGRTENGIAVVGYQTEDHGDDDANRRDVTRQALADLLLHAESMAETIDRTLHVEVRRRTDPRRWN